MNCSHSSLQMPAVHYIGSRPPSTQIWIDSHPTGCCLLSFLLPELRTFFNYASWVILSVATIAVSWWTIWWLHGCCVSPSGSLCEEPVVQLDSAPVAPGGSLSGAMACCCRNVRKMITKINGKCWRLFSELQVKMEWVTANLHIQFKLNPAAYSCRGFQQLCDFSLSVQHCWLVYRDILRWMTADISCLIDMKKSFFDGKNVWWCFYQHIAGIFHESHAHFQVIMYY